MVFLADDDPHRAPSPSWPRHEPTHQAGASPGQNYDVDELYRTGHLETYQRYQGGGIFKGCSHIVVLLGRPKSRALFVGVYKVGAVDSAANHPLPKDFPYQELYSPDWVYYDLEKQAGFEDMENRVVVDWGKGTKSWHQWLRGNKGVVEILPEGYVRDFPGYLDFTISHDELREIVQYPEANRVWHQQLSAVAGIYLVLDRLTGQQYVGSAYGGEGILGRWKQYAVNGHGGNVLLKELVAGDPDRRGQLQYTILRTLPKTMTKGEVVKLEQLYKGEARI